MSRLLKLRQRKISGLQDGSPVQDKNLFPSEVYQASDNLVSSGIKTSRTYFSNASQSTQDWLSSKVETTNQVFFKPLNTAYVSSLRQSQEEHGSLWMEMSVLLAPGSRSYLQNGAFPISGPIQEARYTSLMLKGLPAPIKDKVQAKVQAEVQAKVQAKANVQAKAQAKVKKPTPPVKNSGAKKA